MVQFKRSILITGLCLVVVLLPVFTVAGADESLVVYGGVASYSNPELDSLAQLEFSFSVNRDQLTFFRPEKTDPNLYARVFAQVDLFDGMGMAIDSAVTYFSVKAESRSVAQKMGVRIFDKLTLYVKPAIYSARLTVIDVVSKGKGECFFEKIVVDQIEKDSLKISDISLNYDIRPVSDTAAVANSRLMKSNMILSPNPNAVFTENDTVIYIYGEIYNLKPTPVDADNYEVSFTVLYSDGQLFRELGTASTAKPGESALVVKSFDILGWVPGAYVLRVVAVDPDRGQADTTMTPFRLISRAALLTGTRESEAVDPYDDLDLATQLHLVEYLLVPDRKRSLMALNEAGQSRFLDRFWHDNDVNRSTTIIENRLEMIERYRYVNETFSTDEKNSNGWRTDRGRIFMVYGLWDERDEVSSPRYGNPFDIWRYRQLKEGKHFVFEDWSGTLDYRLVHSNVFGEVFNQEWESRINEELLEIY